MFLDVDLPVLERSVFLDNRIAAPLDAAVAMPARQVPDFAGQSVGWLLHTSFCCSTLLARALHVPPVQVVLKEPLVLRRLADARHAQFQVGSLVRNAVGLLARPWEAGGSVIIKPTHAALNIAHDLLAATPQSRVVILTSTLEDFLISNLKKAPEIQAKIAVLAERALAATGLASRLPARAFSPPDPLCAATLQWAAQREVVADLTRSLGSERIRVLLADRLLEDIPGIAAACTAWLRGSASVESVSARAGAIQHANAKEVGLEYGAPRRRDEARQVKARYAPAIERAGDWFDGAILPAMSPSALTLAAQSATAWR